MKNVKNKIEFWDQKNPTKSFIIYMTGISLMSCGQYTLIGLQSSINVENGLGELMIVGKGAQPFNRRKPNFCLQIYREP